MTLYIAGIATLVSTKFSSSGTKYTLAFRAQVSCSNLKHCEMIKITKTGVPDASIS